MDTAYVVEKYDVFSTILKVRLTKHILLIPVGQLARLVDLGSADADSTSAGSAPH
jgi:hypothetical protein